MRPVMLTKLFSPDQYSAALDSWDWLDIASMTPAAVSLFGDLFLVSSDGYWFLDSIEGTLTRRWDDNRALNDDLATDEGQDQYLLGGLAVAMHEQGLELTADEVYDFQRPPILGGQYRVENVVKMDFVVSLNIAGQLHRQIRAMPLGTTISRFTVEES
jgi:hypothetical protein